MRKTFLFAAAFLLAAGANVMAAQQTQQPKQETEKPAPRPQPDKQTQPKQQGSKEAKASASGSASTSASAQAGGSSASLESGTTFEAVLTKSVDAKKAKRGDRVEAKATKDVKSNGEVVVPKNSKLIGRVTEAKARGEGQAESALGIVFDKAVTKDGREVPLNVLIQAVAASQAALAAQSSANDSSLMTSSAGSAQSSGGVSGGGGGLVGGATSTVGSTVGAAGGAVGGVGQTTGATLGATTQTVGSVAGTAAGLDAAGNLTAGSAGVIGLDGLTLASDISGAAQGSVITSASRNVRLDSGTRMMLRAVGQTSASQNN
jgi:hypothetical protein